MREGVTLELIHEPCRRISKVPVNTIDARKSGMRAIRLALHVIVVGPDQSSLELRDRSRGCIVKGLDRLISRCLRGLGWGRYREVRRSINEEHRSRGEICRVQAVRPERTPHPPEAQWGLLSLSNRQTL